jgi:hydrogenase-4 membrane subunit HyfE
LTFKANLVYGLIIIMPVKKIALDQLQLHEESESGLKSNKVVFGLIIGILILFAINVVY